jgi:putative DNA primase/helicase
MTRQDAIDLILSIVDGARPPAAPVLASVPASSSDEKKGARKARGRTSSASPLPAGEEAPDSATLPPSPPVRPSAALSENSAPSHMGSTAENGADAGEGAAQDAEALAEQRHREAEIKRDVLNRELAHLPMTDLGNVERFRKRFGDVFKWNVSLGWLCWDGRRWAMKGADERVRIAAHETVRAIQEEAKALFAEADKIAEQFEADELDRAEAETKQKKKAEAGKGGLRLVHDADNPKVGKGKKKKKAAPEPEPLDRKKLELFAKYKRTRLLGIALAAWGLDSEMNSKITPIDKHSAPYLAVDVEALDADPWAINVANGTLIVDKTVPGMIRFKAHDPADLITKISPVRYDPLATCDTFDAFLARVQPDEANRRLLIDWEGYSLTGDTSEQKLVMLHGEGRNGKGVFIRICNYIAGDYAKTTPIETFLAETGSRNAAAPTPHLAVLPGVRMLSTNEPKKGAVLDEAFIKLVTGEDTISARPLQKPQFEFRPAFKLTISGNHRPRINDQTESIWARMILVPWTVIIPKEERDLKLDEKLRAEASGVLNVLLDGLRRWLTEGLVISQAITAATDQYREDSDPLGRFLTDCVEKDPGGRVQSTALHELFIAWAKATGGPEWKHTGFTNAMKERGYATKKISVMFYLDIKMTKKLSDFVDHLGRPIADDGGGGSGGFDGAGGDSRGDAEIGF